MRNRWAISDIHGCAQTFRALVENKIGLEKISTLYLLGDYIDRGPDSKAVFDFIFELKSKGLEVISLMGNHEDLMIRSLHSPMDFDLWMANGGDITLESFDSTKTQQVSQAYLDYIRELRLYEELEDYWLVHAAFDTSKDDILENKRALLWKRGMQYDAEKLKNKKVLHGHTPTPVQEIRDSISRQDPVICLDAGCVYKDRKGLGNLCALNLDTFDLVIHQNIDILQEN